MDLKNDLDQEVLRKTETKDTLHKVIDKEWDETWYCDYCKSVHVVKNGKTPAGRQKSMCKDCKKSCSDTRESIIASLKKPYHGWETFILCMMNEYPLRKTANLIDISLPTAHGWEAMGLYDIKAPLSGEIQIDETCFNRNMKGYRDLPRPPKKRETRSYKRGLNREMVRS